MNKSIQLFILLNFSSHLQNHEPFHLQSSAKSFVVSFWVGEGVRRKAISKRLNVFMKSYQPITVGRSVTMADIVLFRGQNMLLGLIKRTKLSKLGRLGLFVDEYKAGCIFTSFISNFGVWLWKIWTNHICLTNENKA